MAGPAPRDERATRAERIGALGYDPLSQPSTRREHCNLCGHDRLLTVAHRDRYGYPVRADGCLRCGLVFLNPVMQNAAYAHFYAQIYRPLVSAYHGRRIDADSIQEEQRAYAGALAELLAPHLERRQAKRLLDVGGSTGVVAHALKQRFALEATVIDPAPLEIEVARRLGLRTITGFVEDYDPGAQRFDLITLCQTVDHLLDVTTALATIREKLSPDGLFFVDIVDFRAACRRNGSVEEAVKIDHVYSITDETMRAWLRRAGFAVRAMDWAADHLHIGYVCEPAAPEPTALPEPASVRAQWRELRAIQNPLPAPR